MAKIKGRWRCPHCGTCGWSSSGAIPPHDRQIGGACRASGMKTEREYKIMVAQKIKSELSKLTNQNI